MSNIPTTDSDPTQEEYDATVTKHEKLFVEYFNARMAEHDAFFKEMKKKQELKNAQRKKHVLKLKNDLKLYNVQRLKRKKATKAKVELCN